jgi:hypothetical protein
MTGRRPLDPPFSDGPARPAWTTIFAVTGLLPAAPPRPFSWQHGRSLWILDREPIGWVLAELRFDPSACTYREIRRARYDWPREAAGVLLGRAMALGEAEAEEIAARLASWQLAADRPNA